MFSFLFQISFLINSILNIIIFLFLISNDILILNNLKTSSNKKIKINMANNQSDIANIKLSGQTRLQHDYYHSPRSGRTMMAKFSFKPYPSAWVVKTGPIIMKKIVEGESVSYQANPNFDILSHAYGIVSLPEIEVLDEFKNKIEVAWCHNIGINIYKKGDLIIAGKRAQSIDSVYHDGHNQFFIKPEERIQMMKNLGNIPNVENFASQHSSTGIVTIHPWSFMKHIYNSIPIHITKDVSFSFRLQLKLLNLLRMREWVNPEPNEKGSEPLGGKGYWKNIHPSLKYIKYTNEVIPVPDYYGRYAKCLDGENAAREEEGKTVYYEDIVCIDSDNPATTNKVSLPLHSTFPTSTIYFMAENLDATEFNNHSNYTDNIERSQGDCPIKQVSLTYKNGYEFEDLKIEHFSMAEPILNDLSSPIESGYCIYSMGYDLRGNNIDNGIVFDKTSSNLILAMKNQDRHDKTQYAIHIRLITNRIIVFRNGGIEIKGEKEIIQGES